MKSEKVESKGLVSHSKPKFEISDFESVCSLLSNSVVADGSKLFEFEELLSKYLGGSTVVTPSGRQALLAALLALEVSGSEIIIPSYVCKSVYEAVVSSGAIPILCDNGADRWVVNKDSILEKVTSKTAGVIRVHTFGTVPFEGKINDSDKSLFLIDDLCQSFNPISDSADLSVFSFFATKEIVIGRGGAVASFTDSLNEKVRAITKDEMVFTPITDLQAILGISQLERIQTYKSRRREIIDAYLTVLPEKLRHPEMLVGGNRQSRMVILDLEASFEEREEEFRSLGIVVRRGVDELLHRYLGFADSDFPEAVKIFDHTVSIPLNPSLSNSDVQRVMDAIKKIWANG